MTKNKFIYIYLISSLFIFANCSNNDSTSSDNEETIKIAHIDPQTGPFALQGASGTSHMRYIVEQINADGGVLGGRKLEIVALDNKTNPQESLVNLEQAIGEGIQYVTQGNGSAVGRALTEAIKKHNARNIGNEVVFLNNAAVDPALTNEICQFWHFRFDAHVGMKANALTSAIANEPSIKKLYLINQDYSYGHAVAREAENFIKVKRPDIEIVGNEFHPFGRVKDFAPYVAKIRDSKADAVLSGNWGNDLSLLIKSAAESGLQSLMYTNYGNLVGTPRTLGASGVNRVRVASSFHQNIDGYPLEDLNVGYKKQSGEDWVHNPYKYVIEMWAMAINKAGSANPKAVALALENLSYDGGVGKVTMRKEDHQLMLPLYVSSFSELGGQVKYDSENTGFGWKTNFVLSAEETELPHTCEMDNRP